MHGKRGGSGPLPRVDLNLCKNQRIEIQIVRSTRLRPGTELSPLFSLVFRSRSPSSRFQAVFTRSVLSCWGLAYKSYNSKGKVCAATSYPCCPRFRALDPHRIVYPCCEEQDYRQFVDSLFSNTSWYKFRFYVVFVILKVWA